MSTHAKTSKMFKASQRFTAKEIYFVLCAILDQLEELNAQLDASPQVFVSITHEESLTLVHLKYLGGTAEASEVAKLTGRARATESHILNNLVRRGICIKRKVGKKVYFTLKERSSKSLEQSLH